MRIPIFFYYIIVYWSNLNTNRIKHGITKKKNQPKLFDFPKIICFFIKN